MPVRAAGNADLEAAARALRPESWLRNARLREAAALLDAGQVEAANTMLRAFLQSNAGAPGALFLLGELASRMGADDDAERLLAQCVKVQPAFAPFRFAHANLTLRMNRQDDALADAETLLEQHPQNPLFRQLRAIVLQSLEDYPAAVAAWRALADDHPSDPDLWVQYGHALRGLGSREDALAAYRKALSLNPSFGGAWWALADMKTLRFSDDEVATMEAQLGTPGLADDDGSRLHFALGKAYADRKSYKESFTHYAKGNAIERLGITHDPGVLTAYVARCKSLFTADFFAQRDGLGCDDPAPIFIVGMARAGSTLVEQILASHSQVEGTRELSDLATLARQVPNDPAAAGHGYPGALAHLDRAALTRLGERYLESTRAHRRTDRPRFIDKMGANFVHAGLIHLALPNARIVDVRRHPLACGFSIFAQLFPSGQNDSYRLSDIGRLYRSYVELMAHVDRVLPGRVHRVFYEQLVGDPDAEIRRLLAYLGLPFEPACLQFHETDRAVATASSEQVRRPLYRDALEQWRPFEPWLGPLKDALGPVLDAYPDVPAFD
jgi:tetratricopeptide (TPR) repeat protein